MVIFVENIRRRQLSYKAFGFLWGDSKTHLVGCDKICAPIANGGLGLGNLLLSIRPYWGNGCSGLGRKRIGYEGG